MSGPCAERRVESGPESTKILHRDSLSGNGEVTAQLRRGLLLYKGSSN